MINLILFGSFFVMLLLNIPIAVSLGMSSIFALLYSGSPLTVVPTNVYNGMAKFLLLAIPFFVLSGNIMAKAGISSRLVAFADDCVGHRRGGIAIVAVIVACFFGAISGSGPATVAALGIILIPAMINRGGFSAPFASSLMASASSIAIVIPPSIAFVVYASITGVSVGDMFMGGWIPGIMMGLALVSDELPILKQNNAILAFAQGDALLREPTACIRCGRCVAACPMGLMPTKLEEAAEAGDGEKLRSLHVMTCMECGCCAYSCPAGRRLVQAIRMGKALVKKEGGKK